MSRTYFSGVSQVAYNGHLLSFSLDDVYRTDRGEDRKTSVVVLISELDTIEGVCRYILAEIGNIRRMAGAVTSEGEPFHSTETAIEDVNLSLGPRLGVTLSEHSED